MDRDLGQVGIPFQYWNVDLTRKVWPGGSTAGWEKFESLMANPQRLFDDNINIVITSGDRRGRVLVASWIAQYFGDRENLHYRLPGEHKRTNDTLVDGEPFTQPFKVRMMDVDELEMLFKECQRDEIRTFAGEVVIPDFFFLHEIGSGTASSFTARIIRDLLVARQDEQVPSVVTLYKRISNIEDKAEEKVYKEVTNFITGWEKVSLR